MINNKAIKDEIKNIIYGKSGNSQKTLIRTVADYLRASERASTLVKKDKQYKQEKESLISEATKMRDDLEGSRDF